MNKVEKLFLAELNEIARADGWSDQRRRSMAGILKSKAGNEEKAAFIRTIKRRPSQCNI